MASRRKNIQRNVLAEGQTSGFDDGSLRALDEATFGALGRIEEDRQVAEPVSIFQIRPDPAQARRVIPARLREQWDGTPQTVQALLRTWQQEAQAQYGAPFDLAALVFGEGESAITLELEDDAPAQQGSVLVSALVPVAKLAASIAANGLTNPITVSRVGASYMIETGERRWLAYHLLYLLEENDRWERIPARTVERSVWRQASENTAREDLNAISRARQLAILLMDLYAREGTQFQPFEALVQPGRCDRAFYAQVSDEVAFRVPRGTMNLLLNAMGFRNRATFLRYRRLLKLPDTIWMAADDYSCPENVLREMDGQPYNIQASIFNAWARRERNVAVGNQPVETAREEAWESPNKRPVVNWKKHISELQQIDPEEIDLWHQKRKDELLAYLDELEDWITAVRLKL
ncbi:MAG: ParB N-terminal domain-containing protein [Anaerolineae bacterium]|nr:ParB N-terminal domain-containing protein [Anaerolineae bacterium]